MTDRETQSRRYVLTPKGYAATGGLPSAVPVPWRCDAHGIWTTSACPACDAELIALAEADAEPRPSGRCFYCRRGQCWNCSSGEVACVCCANGVEED